jgi:hypothetical protein
VTKLEDLPWYWDKLAAEVLNDHGLRVAYASCARQLNEALVEYINRVADAGRLRDLEAGVRAYFEAYSDYEREEALVHLRDLVPR